MKVEGLKITMRGLDGTPYEIEAAGVIELDVREFEDFEVQGLSQAPGFQLESRTISLTFKSVGLGPSMTVKVVEE